MQTSLSIRQMTPPELRRQIELADQEGWEPGAYDADLFWYLDPDGFLAIEENGQTVGGGAIINYENAFGFMGLFIVEQPYRGRGLGRELWFARRDALRARLNPGATIGLDGVYDMVPFYETGGFERYSHHRRFQLLPSDRETKFDSGILPLPQVEESLIVKYDRQCFPASRTDFLSAWIRQPNAISLGYMNSGQLQGFGVMRRCSSGYRIGPLFADSSLIAKALLTAFQSQQGDQPLFMDVPDYNPEARQICESYGMEEVFGCVRMYLGEPPQLAENKIYAVTTLEVG